LDAQRTESAETQVRQWREEGKLPFPNFSPELSTTRSEPEIQGSLPL
jgi:hypothetical protein